MDENRSVIVNFTFDRAVSKLLRRLLRENFGPVVKAAVSDGGWAKGTGLGKRCIVLAVHDRELSGGLPDAAPDDKWLAPFLLIVTERTGGETVIAVTEPLEAAVRLACRYADGAPDLLLLLAGARQRLERGLRTLAQLGAMESGPRIQHEQSPAREGRSRPARDLLEVH